MKVLITHWVHEEVLRYLETFAEVHAPSTPGDVWPRERTLAEASDADAIITCMADWIDETFLEACSKLRIVAATLKGYDNYDVAACTRRGIWLTIVPDIIIPPTAELAVSLALGVMRNVRQGDDMVRSGEFTAWRPLHYGMSLSGATVGMVGMGNLGQAVARLLTPFGVAAILYFDQQEMEADKTRAGPRWERVELAELLGRSDLVIVSLPLTASTHHLVNAECLKNLENRSYMVNIGRGSVVDESAVLEALNSGQLSGYAADVFEFEDWALKSRPEKIPDALRQHPRTLFTPHLGSAVASIRRDMSMKAAEQVHTVFKGEKPGFAVNDLAS